MKTSPCLHIESEKLGSHSASTCIKAIQSAQEETSFREEVFFTINCHIND